MLDRRTLLGSIVATGIGSPAALSAHPQTPSERLVAAQRQWSEPPLQAPVEAGLRASGAVRLFAWDTGGPGPAIIFIHPATGSHASWPYQQPVFAGAGYRVIGYSRRNYLQSDASPPASPVDDADDLARLLDALAVDRAHLVASAAGGLIALDFLALHRDRVASLVLASSMAFARTPQAMALVRGLLPAGWRDLPSEFQELSPSYRAANPDGVRRWVAIEHQARHGPAAARGQPRPGAMLDPASFPPLLAMTGDADLYAPPPLMRMFGDAVPSAELASFAEAGHALFWEQPLGFNRIALDFLDRVASPG